MQRIQLFCAAGALVLMTVAGDYFVLQDGYAADQEKMLTEAVQCIEKFPDQIGAWSLESTVPFSARTLQMLQVKGNSNRVYVHSETGERVTLTLLVGMAGPLVAHSPEICLQSRDFDMLAADQREQVSSSRGDTCELGRATFKVRSLRAEIIDVYYAWSRNGREWETPAHPRLALGGNPMLYKLQVSATAPSDKDDPQLSISKRFLRDLLPVLQRELSTPTMSQNL